MAQTRRASRLTTGFASLGLCLTVCTVLLWHVTAQHRDENIPQVHNHFRAWLARAAYQFSQELELWGRQGGVIGPNGAVAPEAPGAPVIDPAARLGIDLSGLREALVLYASGELSQGDAAAGDATDPLVRTTLAWVALHDLPQDTGIERMRAFLDAHPGWPTREAIEHRIQDALYFSHASAEEIESGFEGNPPETPLGRLALARAFLSDGDKAAAQRLVLEVWHKSELTPALEAKVTSEFGALIDKKDDKARADYLLYKGDDQTGLHAASLAGPGIFALAKVRVAANNDRANDKMFAALPKAMLGGTSDAASPASCSISTRRSWPIGCAPELRA